MLSRRRPLVLAGMLSVAVAVCAGAQPIRAGKTASGIAYDVRGSGPVVVLLTGSNLDRRMWTREAEWLSKDHTVVRYDLRAHGESDTATSEFTHLDDLVAVLDALKIEKATLIGLVRGLGIALDAALDLPHRVERIVLAGPGVSGLHRQGAAVISARKCAGDPGEGVSPRVGDPAEVAGVRGGAGIAGARAADGDENERLWTVDRALMKNCSNRHSAGSNQVRVPTLVIDGENDVFQSDHADVLAARVPGARLVVVPGRHAHCQSQLAEGIRRGGQRVSLRPLILISQAERRA